MNSAHNLGFAIMYNILVVGAGYLGSAVARHFKDKKQRVYAVTRSAFKAAEFEAEGILPVMADLHHPKTLEKIPPAHFIVISAAPDESTEEEYRRVYLDGIRHFLQSRAGQPRPYLIVSISSTSVWKDAGGEWVHENVPADAETEKGKILRASEELVLESGYPAVIFRLSGIYGPGRNRLAAFRASQWPGQEPDAYMNMIHVEDAAGAIAVLFKEGKEGGIYTGTDDEPVLRSEFCGWLSHKMGRVPVSISKPQQPGGKRLMNTRLKEMGFKFRYPTFREGYGSFMEKEK